MASSRFVVRMLKQLANLIGDATGEVQRLTGDALEMWYGFYTIRGGRLFRQRGEVVRQQEDEVAGEGL